MDKRKAIRLITVLESDETESLLALCDDGTVWLFKDDDREWEQLPGIPQPAVTDQ